MEEPLFDNCGSASHVVINQGSCKPPRQRFKLLLEEDRNQAFNHPIASHKKSSPLSAKHDRNCSFIQGASSSPPSIMHLNPAFCSTSHQLPRSCKRQGSKFPDFLYADLYGTCKPWNPSSCDHDFLPLLKVFRCHAVKCSGCCISYRSRTLLGG